MNNNKIGKSLFWKLFERFGITGVQFVLQIVLARLLSPNYYGILSIMLVFISLATVFSQHGFNTALVQNKDVTEDDYSSVLWVSLLVAFVLYILIFISAPLIAYFYDMPDLISPMRTLALILFPGAINSVQLAKVSREMDFKKVFYSNIGASIVSGIVGIFIAYFGGGLWALVAQSFLNITIACIVMRFTVSLKIRLVCNINRIRVLFSFGWKLLVSQLLNTLYQDLRSLVIGKKYDSNTLGFYNRGKQFPQFINDAVNGSVNSVMLPAMASVQGDISQVKSIMRTSISSSAYIMFPIMWGLAAVSTPVVSIMLTDKWLPCVPFMQIYCFTFGFYPVHTCNLQAINAMGRSDIFLKLEVIKKLYGIAFLVLAVVYFDSPISIAATGLITTWISWGVNAHPNKKLLGYSFREQLIDLLPSILFAGIMYIIVIAVQFIGLNMVLTLVVQVFTGIFVYLVLSVVFKPAPYRFLLSKLIEILKNKKLIK